MIPALLPVLIGLLAALYLGYRAVGVDVEREERLLREEEESCKDEVIAALRRAAQLPEAQERVTL